MKELSQNLKKQLKQAAHHLEPIVILGQKGLTNAVLKEIDHALNARELIKLRINIGEKSEREIISINICKILHADLIQLIGKTLTIWRKNNLPAL